MRDLTPRQSRMLAMALLLAAVGATGRVVVLDTAGQTRYQYDLGAAPRSVAVPEARPDLLCVATADGRVTALAPPGKERSGNADAR